MKNAKVPTDTIVTAFGPGTCTISGVEGPYDRAFVLIGDNGAIRLPAIASGVAWKGIGQDRSGSPQH